jgi:hypothetical protein
MCSHPSTAFPRPVMDIEVKLEPQPQAAGLARRFVAQELEALGYVELVDDARLMVSELVTNSGAPRGALSYPRHSREELKGGSWV